MYSGICDGFFHAVREKYRKVLLMAYKLIVAGSTLLTPMSRITTSNTLTSLSLLGLSPPVPLFLLGLFLLFLLALFPYSLILDFYLTYYDPSLRPFYSVPPFDFLSPASSLHIFYSAPSLPFPSANLSDHN